MIRLSYPADDQGERSALFDGLVVRFGTDAQCELRLRPSQDVPIQRSHGEFISFGDSYVVVGKDAACRLWVDGKPVQRARLKGGEQIRVGSPTGPQIRVVGVGRAAKDEPPREATPVSPPVIATPPSVRDTPPMEVASRRAEPTPAPPTAKTPPNVVKAAENRIKPPEEGSQRPGDLGKWLDQAQDKIQQARAKAEGQSSGQTMMIVAEALSGMKQTAERRITRGRQTLLYGGIGTLIVVSLLGSVILFQQQKIGQLVKEKAAIDAQIHQLSEAMERETDEARLAEMEGRLEQLMGSAREKVSQVRQSSPKKGEELSEPQDELERDFRKLLRSFNAETYVIPPNFKAMLRQMVAELVSNPALRANYARREKYWPAIQSALAAHELPAELGYITFTESRFDPYAHNAKSGAAGMWQLMPVTARNCGITVNTEKDDRYNPAKASKAAACYLSKLLVEFGQESFMLVLASYNRGENGVRTALHRVAQEPGGYKKRDFWHLYRLKYLPDETRDYVPRVLAAALVFEHPEKYGLTSAQ